MTDTGGLTSVGIVTIEVTPAVLNGPIAMSELMGPANGGVAGLDSYDNFSTGLTEFEIWTDTYNAGTLAFQFIDSELNYYTGVFDALPEDVADGFVLSGGFWVQATDVTVTAFGTGTGSKSMDVLVANGGTTLEQIRVSAEVQDISGDRLDATLTLTGQRIWSIQIWSLRQIRN